MILFPFMSMSSSMVSKFEEYPKSSDIYYLKIAYPFGYVILTFPSLITPSSLQDAFSGVLSSRRIFSVA